MDDGLVGAVGKGRHQMRLDRGGILRQERLKAHIPSAGVVPTARPSCARIISTFSSAAFSLSAQCDFNAAPRS
jgi:hypothetical protein